MIKDFIVELTKNFLIGAYYALLTAIGLIIVVAIPISILYGIGFLLSFIYPIHPHVFVSIFPVIILFGALIWFAIYSIHEWIIESWEAAKRKRK